MGGKQNCQSAFSEFGKYVQKFVSGKWIQPAGGFVQDQNFSPVGQGEQEIAFHFHALGELGGRFIFVDVKEREILLTGAVIPRRKKGLCYGNNIPDFLRG